MSINKETLQRKKELQGDVNMDFSIVEEMNQETDVNVETIVTGDTLLETYVDEGVETIEADNKELLINSKSVLAKNRSRSYTDSVGGALSMVNANTGKRIVMSKESYEQLGQPEKVQFALTDEELLIGKTLDNASDNFNVKNYKNKGTIYSVALVKEITEAFGLDYSDRTSITFGEASFINVTDNDLIMVVKIK